MSDRGRVLGREAPRPRGDERGPHRGGHGPERDDWFEGRDERGRGRRGRVERGMMRYVLLEALRDGPKHGYEIIKWLDERTGGAYAPSPGAVYPTLQLLGDLGFVRAGQEEDRRTYALTDTGQSALNEHAEAVRHFWARFAGDADPRRESPEAGFVQDELHELTRTVWVAVRAATAHDDQATTRAVRAAVERCKNEVRAIIAGGATATDTRTVE